MKLILYDRLYLELAEISPAHKLKLEEKFSPSNPKFFFEKNSGRSTRRVPKRIKMYEETDGFFVLPIGILYEVYKFLDWYGYKYEVVDKRVEGTDSKFEFDPDITLEDYQEEAISSMEKSRTCNGLIQAPPGAGKTLLSLSLIARMKKRALVIVHEKRLLDQWVVEINKRGRGDFTVQSFDGSGHAFGDITIVLIQSGYLYKDSYPEFKDYGLVIVDECHHSSASTGIFAKFLHNLPAKYKFGLSGTLKRKDKMDFVVEYFLGTKLIDIPESRTKNRVTDFDVEFIETHMSVPLPWNTRDGKPFWVEKEGLDGTITRSKNYLRVSTAELLEILTGFKGSKEYSSNITDDEIINIGLSGKAQARNQLIVNRIIDDIKIRHVPIILTNRTMHARFVYAYLKREGYNGIILTGETSKQYDVEEIRSSPTANGERIYFIVASEKIAAEALDIPYLSSLHLTIPSQNQFKIKQCLGRIRRRASDKLSPVVRDYVDREHDVLPGEGDYFEKSAKARRGHYSKWKKEYSKA